MSTNDVTGARLVSRVNDKLYDENYDRIFKKMYREIEDEVAKEDCCIKYEEANGVSDKIRNLIKDNEVDVIND